jgi:hypothetical protein
MRLGIRTEMPLKVTRLFVVWRIFTDQLLDNDNFLWSAIWNYLWYVLLVPKKWKLSYKLGLRANLDNECREPERRRED